MKIETMMVTTSVIETVAKSTWRNKGTHCTDTHPHIEIIWYMTWRLAAEARCLLAGVA